MPGGRRRTYGRRVSSPQPAERPHTPAAPATLPTTLAALRASGHQYRTVKEEIRANLLARMRSGETRFPGVVGFDETVLPDLERALLAGHDLVLLGERGQGKTRVIRTIVGLLEEWTPVIAGSELHEHPYEPITPAGRRRPAELRDPLPPPSLHPRERYPAETATPPTRGCVPTRGADPIQVGPGPPPRRPPTPPLP